MDIIMVVGGDTMTNMRVKTPMPHSGDDVIDVEVGGAEVAIIAMKEVGTTGPMVVGTMTGEAEDLTVAAAIEATMIIRVEETGTMMTNMLEIGSTTEARVVLVSCTLHLQKRLQFIEKLQL